MLLKKINAGLSLVTCAVVLAHVGMGCRTLLTGWYDPVLSHYMPLLTMAAVLLHALLSVAIVLFAHDGSSPRHAKANLATILQRASGLLMIALVHVHVHAYDHVVARVRLSAAQRAGFAVGEAAFYACVFVHMAVSLPKALITLGLPRSERAVRRIERASYILGALGMAAACGSMLSFFLKG